MATNTVIWFPFGFPRSDSPPGFWVKGEPRKLRSISGHSHPAEYEVTWRWRNLWVRQILTSGWRPCKDQLGGFQSCSSVIFISVSGNGSNNYWDVWFKMLPHPPGSTNAHSSICSLTHRASHNGNSNIWFVFSGFDWGVPASEENNTPLWVKVHQSDCKTRPAGEQGHGDADAAREGECG